MCPSIFQSKKLQDYLGWKITSTHDQKPQTEKVRDFSHFNPFDPSCILSFNDLTSQAGCNFPSSQQSREDVLSITSESDVFEDAVGEPSPTQPNLAENNVRIQVLERQLQSEKEESRMQLNLLNKILSPLKDQHSYNQVLVIQKLINKSITDARAF